jgi:hypothetical protein
MFGAKFQVDRQCGQGNDSPKMDSVLHDITNKVLDVEVAIDIATNMSNNKIDSLKFIDYSSLIQNHLLPYNFQIYVIHVTSFHTLIESIVNSCFNQTNSSLLYQLTTAFS